MDLRGLAMYPGWAAGAAFAAGLVLLGLERRGRGGIGPVGALAVLALGVGLAPLARPSWTALAVGLVTAALARDQDELLHSECALKLLWVMGSALALSWAGLELLTVATGTPVVLEQWAVLQLGLEPSFLWNTALPLSLLVGLVLLGGAPFHFWIADVFQGVRPWLAPLAVAALQVAGAAWLSLRLAGIEAFPAGARLADALTRIAAAVAFIAGGATLLVQRRPERRAGTLASLNGALILALLAGRSLGPGMLAAWSAHLALALTGASTLTRFMPASTPRPALGAPLLRRHPLASAAGLYALFSLAGIPGTPGAGLWLAAARGLARAGRTGLLMALVAAWLAALSVAIRQVREAYGVPMPASATVRSVPAQARGALWIAGAGLLVLGLSWWLGP